MYTYKITLGLERSINSVWSEYTTPTVMLSQLFARFSEFYVTVYDSYTDKDIHVEMNSYRPSLATSDETLADWLTSVAGIPLHGVEELPNEGYKYAEYANAVLHGYKIEPTKIGYNAPDNYPVTAFPDLKVTRPRLPTNLSLLHTHCLMSVNGFYHRTTTDGDSAFIVDGNITAMKTPCSHTGILSFMAIGGVSLYSFKKEDIVPLDADGSLKDGMILRADADVAGKSVFLVLGGYLIRPENAIFYSISEGNYVFRIKGIPYINRYFESVNSIDLDSLPVIKEENATKSSAINQESLWTDECIKAYLQLSQSFLVIVDSEELFFENFGVRVSNIPGFIAAYREPVYPLIMGYGKHVEYSKVKESEHWALRVQDPYYRQYAFNTTVLPLVKTVSDNLLPYKQYLRTTGYMLKIAGRKKK